MRAGGAHWTTASSAGGGSPPRARGVPSALSSLLTTGGPVWEQATNENVSPSVLNRLIKEVKEYTKNPVSDIVLQVNEGNVTDIRADLHGPGIVSNASKIDEATRAAKRKRHPPLERAQKTDNSCICVAAVRCTAETPYEGGVFRMRLVFGPDFPAAPPKGLFVTPIFHPNVSKQGEICVNTLKKDWKAECKLSHILMVCSSCLGKTRCARSPAGSGTRAALAHGAPRACMRARRSVLATRGTARGG